MRTEPRIPAIQLHVLSGRVQKSIDEWKHAFEFLRISIVSRRRKDIQHSRSLFVHEQQCDRLIEFIAYPYEFIRAARGPFLGRISLSRKSHTFLESRRRKIRGR